MLKISVIIPIAPDETAHQQLIEDLKDTDFEIIISSENSRAKSLNGGAAKATGDILWFLHADSRITQDNLKKLVHALKTRPTQLHYFDLRYEEGGLATLNAIGANIRSQLFGLPYGDQGFCLSKEQFQKMKGFPEAPFGEDLLFIRAAKHAGFQLNRIPSKLMTSARKYRDVGWLKLTALRQLQLFKLLRQPL